MIDEQHRIDADRGQMADKIVADAPLADLAAARRFARGWIITAAQHAANEEYYRGQLDAVLIVLGHIGELGGVAGELAKNALYKLGRL
jgi:hypothetical protein